MPGTFIVAYGKLKYLEVGFSALMRLIYFILTLFVLSCPVFAYEIGRDIPHDPYTTVEEVSAEFTLMRELLFTHKDHRAIFTAVYLDTSYAILKKIDNGFFSDPDWAKRILISFANLYKTSMLEEEIESDGPVPRCWERSFRENHQAEEKLSVQLLLGDRKSTRLNSSH